jgi:hypothetical protein
MASKAGCISFVDETATHKRWRMKTLYGGIQTSLPGNP